MSIGMPHHSDLAGMSDDSGKRQPAIAGHEIRHELASVDVSKQSHNADEAMKLYESAPGESIVIDSATHKRLLRSIDFHLMPVMCVVYGLNYLDKTALSYASVMGIQKDIGLSGNDYQWLSSMFYFGYLAWEYPTNRLLQRMPLAKYSGICICLWGAVLACFAAVNNYSGAIAVRFMLGVCEAAVSPGFALFTSQWYTIAEQGTRTGIWFSFNGFAQIFGGLVAYGIAVGTERHPAAIESWKIVFLAIGLLTVVVGIIFLLTMPDNQLNARWLSAEDRLLAVERIRVNQQGVGNKYFKWYQCKEALLDPLTWAFVAYALVSDIPNGGISNFFSQLIRSFGYTPNQSLLYGTPGGAVEVVSLILWAYLGDKLHNRILVSCVGLLISIIGMALIVGLPLDNAVGRLIGYYLTQSSPAPFVCLLSFVSTNVAGYTKKTTVAALYFIGYCIGNIVGPQTFRPSDAPRYVPAEVTILVCWGVCLGLMLLIYTCYRRENARKARVRADPEYVKLENVEWLDLTDSENPEFVYVL